MFGRSFLVNMMNILVEKFHLEAEKEYILNYR